MATISSLQRNKLLSLGCNLLLAARKNGNVGMVQTLAVDGSGLKLCRWLSLGTSSKLIQSDGAEKPKLDLKSSMKYCMDQVKEHDYENYLWSTQLQVDRRVPVIVIRALGVEIGQVSSHANTEMLLLMRYQWWRDAVNKAFSSTKSYELTQPAMHMLSEVIKKTPLSRYRIMRMIKAYEDDALRTRPISTMTDLEQFTESTASQLLYLQLEACNEATSETEHAASHLGIAVGICSVLRNALASMQKGRTYFPEEVCAEFGTTPAMLETKDGVSALPDIVLKIATVAKSHLEKAKECSVPDTAKPLFMPSLSVELYLDALQQANFDLLSSRMHRGGYLPLQYLLMMKYRLWSNTY